MARLLIKTGIGFAVAILVLFVVCLIVFPPLQGIFRTQTYIVSRSTFNSWQTIQYENPNCPPLRYGLFSQEIEIPSTGFLCSSSKLNTGWHKLQYFIRDEAGVLQPLSQEKILRPSSFSRSEATTGANGVIINGLEKCEWQGEQFFVGERSALTELNPIMSNPAFLDDNPNCRKN